ncbi:cytochrome b-245 chaperone 1 [Microcaecilia unicolor]|uniref:Essential for reactive oxygen species protein n=1 Tax=Microcaecilia unicolor TaxID=1415580 RepID=A0A6P7YG34_9AMPH|nr:cytochrome b-245 chaperone 1 homolog [Microcaecilia unicolor]XP_030063991.1 cytochrome b-245 chaperone 1 homolog [Microcaecilia unicolor]XP_030063992.1 cytochrome b-245 chaperone 1 homolog [Microcaecilia unicolor]XP_030063993.1 cytochrome b-245 chaperone 1 homolog [Microcaecilia unicolor]XP_030063994.1 cytochrome b-245 chaperone 1 homolog [Microcaecilia unicolor]
MYMQVESRTGTLLHLKRYPSIRSWSLFVGISSIGLAAAYYSSDNLAWKLFYVTGCLFVAIQNLEEWEEAVFDKKTEKVTLKTFNLYKRFLTLWKGGCSQAVFRLKEIRDVNVEEEKVRYFGKGFLIVLRFVTGFSHPLTQCAVLGVRSEVEAIAKLITTFLELDLGVNQDRHPSQSSDTDGSDPEEPITED